MIGISCKADQRAAVEELFELFKTPWEYYAPGRTYDVVMATGSDIPEIDTRLLIVYGAGSTKVDKWTSIPAHAKYKGGFLVCEGTAAPIYGDLATFKEENGLKACLKATCGIVGVRTESPTGTTLLRLGYDLFEEVRLLLSTGQAIEHAHIPTLDIHIGILRSFMLDEGIAFLEIRPSPAGHNFVVCLTHDIDFVSIRNHKFDHTMWGFLYRSTVGAIRNLFRRRISIKRLFEVWQAVARLPFVYLGWAEDFWSPFEWYLQVEKGLPATYFLIPFKGRRGEHVLGKHAARRAAGYDLAAIQQWAEILKREGCEVGVHGIDAWHSAEKGRAELARLTEFAGASVTGIRMHWLLRDVKTAFVLEEGGYTYDSTAGYNETIGFRNGTSQAFRPLGAKTLLELPLHIQDGALFFPDRLDLAENEAERRCKNLIENAGRTGGVLTLVWHDRSHAPERLWGDFYIGLIEVLKSSDAWFATAGQAVSWFRKRREVHFEGLKNGGLRVCLNGDGGEVSPPLSLRIYRPLLGTHPQSPSEREVSSTDVAWDGRTIVEFDSSFEKMLDAPVGLSA